MGSTADVVVGSIPHRIDPTPSHARSHHLLQCTCSGHRWAAVLIIGAFVATLAGLGSLAYIAFVPLTLLVTGWLLWQRRWYAYLTLTGWMWLLTPFLRRVIDWKVGYHPSSLILVPPAVAGLMAIPVLLAHRRRVDRTIGIVFLIGLVTFSYGAVVGLLRNGTIGTAVDVLAIIGPFCAGLFALTVPDDPERLRRTILQLSVYGAILIGAYGILQFFVVPVWDARWMIDSGVTTTGKPLPGLIRVFSTLNDPTPYAEVLAPMMLIALAERRAFLRVLVLLAGLPALGLSLVRTAWIAISVAIIGLLNNGRVKLRGLLIVLGAGLVGLAIIGGPAATSLYQRFDKSVSSGSTDTSVQARLSFQGSIAGPTLADPIGQGMGSTGTALKLGGKTLVDKRFASVDSGIFENATTYGSVLGLALVLGLFIANVAAWRRARRGPPIAAYGAAAITVLMVSMFFVNTVKNAPGFLLWILLAIAARTIPSAISTPPPTAHTHTRTQDSAPTDPRAPEAVTVG